MPLVDKHRWQALEPLLDTALDLTTEERSRWLDQLTARSPELAADLRSLLDSEAAAEAGSFLADPVEPSLAGMEIGAYRLERPIGQGGMGTVWLARRADGRFEGHAAVKILNLGLLTPTGQERLRREGSVLARLTHPGIARLLDAGIAGSGQPYLVLEYVDGQPIDQYVREHAVSPEECIRLFLQVLAAVGHAHANLIVHRDIKPSNILVTAEGAVKLLDFGIAKLLDTEAGDHSALTLEGGRVFTPQYAAPEQVRGEPLTTATDVYALGVLLYVLLSGKHPTAEGCRTPAESIRAILEAEPARLGRGDLYNILGKAMRKQPAERYQTVAAFAGDLERYLRHEPVSARPHSLSYRAAKFTRRNRTTVIAGAVTAVGLLAATVFSLEQMQQAQLQRDDARLQRDNAVYQQRRAAASSGFMELLLQSIAPTGKAYTMQEMLDKARELLESDYRGDPRFMGRMSVELAQHYFEIHDRPRELSLLRRAEELANRSHDPETAGLAACKLAKSAADDGDSKAAQAALDRASRQLAQIHPPALEPEVQCLRSRSALARLGGDTQQALYYARRGVWLGDVAGDHTSSSHLEAMNEVARAMHDDGDIRGALGMTRVMMGVMQQLNRGHTLPFAVEQYNEAALLSRLGEKRNAGSALAKALSLAAGMNPEKKPPTYMTLLTGELAADMGRPAAAVNAFQAAMADSRQQHDTAYQVRALDGLSGALLDQKRPREAAPYVDELSRIAPEQFRWRAQLLEARLLYARGKPDEARRRYLEVLRSRGFPNRGLSTPYFSSLVLEGALMTLGSGDSAAAESLAGDALRLALGEGQDDRRSGVIGYALATMARVRLARGDLVAARDNLRRGMVGLDAGYGPDHPRTVEARALLDSLDRQREVTPALQIRRGVTPGAAAAEPFASPAAPSAPIRPAARRPPPT